MNNIRLICQTSFIDFRRQNQSKAIKQLSMSSASLRVFFVPNTWWLVFFCCKSPHQHDVSVWIIIVAHRRLRQHCFFLFRPNTLIL